MKQVNVSKRSAAPALVANFTIAVTPSAQLADEGSYAGRVQMVVDLGIQPGMTPKDAPRRQIALTFELFGATSAGAGIVEPVLVSKRTSLAFGPKSTLRPMLRAILGRDLATGEQLNPAAWIGAPVQVVIEHTARADGSISMRIASVARYSGPALPAPRVPPMLHPGSTSLTDLPEWCQKALGEQLHAAKV